MSRVDGKNKGTFNRDLEINQIEGAMEGWREANGDNVRYFRLNQQKSEFDDVFYEATGVGRVYDGPYTLPVQHVTFVPGGNENTDRGFYQNDSLVVTVAYKAFTGAGFIFPDLQSQEYLRDRILYNDLIFRVTDMSEEGKVNTIPTVIQISATQMKPDELIDDANFKQWSA